MLSIPSLLLEAHEKASTANKAEILSLSGLSEPPSAVGNFTGAEALYWQLVAAWFVNSDPEELSNESKSILTELEKIT